MQQHIDKVVHEKMVGIAFGAGFTAGVLSLVVVFLVVARFRGA